MSTHSSGNEAPPRALAVIPVLRRITIATLTIEVSALELWSDSFFLSYCLSESGDRDEPPRVPLRWLATDDRNNSYRSMGGAGFSAPGWLKSAYRFAPPLDRDAAALTIRVRAPDGEGLLHIELPNPGSGKPFAPNT